MKLSQYARTVGISYKTAWRWYKAGTLDAYQTPTGMVVVRDPRIEQPVTERIALYARVSSADQKTIRKLALAISDVGLGEFKRQMTYKTVWQGETLLLADRWFPSTKMCSRCRNVKEDMDLSERIYVCENPACGLVIDRDVNAALNLAALAKTGKHKGSLPGVPREG